MRQVVGRLPRDGNMVSITGGQHGVDVAVLGYTLALWPHAHHVVVAPARPYDVRGVERLVNTHKAFAHVEVYNCLPGTDYVYRDYMMLQMGWSRMARASYTSELVAFPLWPEGAAASKRSGTWKTVRAARAAQLPIQAHIVGLVGGG